MVRCPRPCLSFGVCPSGAFGADFILDFDKVTREDLNASGVYDGVTTNLGAIISVQKSGFVFTFSWNEWVQRFRLIS
jgi:hypothetical protein